MKLRMLSVLVLLIAIFTAGCTNVQVEEAKSLGPILTEEQYEENVVAANETYQVASDLIDEIIELIELGADDAWYAKAEIAYIQLELAVKEFRGLNPPTTYQAGHNTLLKSMEYYEKTISIAREHLKNRDINSLWETSEPMNKANELANKGILELAKAQQVYNESKGEITAEMVEDLDAIAGIDNKSVINNITVGGPELIGNWGRFEENGNFSVVMSFEKNGIYKSYKIGEYPSTKNGAIGTWVYDITTRSIIFYTDALYADGKKESEFRTDMTMAITYFKEGTMKVTDIETFKNFAFDKEGSTVVQNKPSSIISDDHIMKEMVDPNTELGKSWIEIGESQAVLDGVSENRQQQSEENLAIRIEEKKKLESELLLAVKSLSAIPKDDIEYIYGRLMRLNF